MSTNTIITITPKTVTLGGKFKITIAFEPEPGDPIPNDVHVEWTELGENDWKSLLEAKNITFGEDGPYKLAFEVPAPSETGTYDVRVRWTHNRRKIGERISQVFVKERT